MKEEGIAKKGQNSLRANPIEPSTMCKFLGVVLDSGLSQKQHINYDTVQRYLVTSIHATQQPSTT